MKKVLLCIVFLALKNVAAQMPSGIDSSFGNEGNTILVPSTTKNINFGNLTLTSNDEIYTVGHLSGGGNNEDFYIPKTDKDGAIVSSFGNNGTSIYDPKLGANDRIFDAVVQADGKILLAGSVDGAQNKDVLVIRLNTDGSIDHTFGDNGMSIVSIKGDDEAHKIAIHNNKIYVGGRNIFNSQFYDSFIIRLNMNGNIDQSFGDFGIVIIDPFDGDRENFEDFTIEGNGSIYVIGQTIDNVNTQQYLCKLMPDGNFDNNFGNNGYFLYQENSPTKFYSVNLAPNNEIYISGEYRNGGYSQAALWKVNANGALSNTFGGGNGKAVLNTGAQTDQQFLDFEVLDNGDIFLVGLYRINGGIIKGITAVITSNGILNTNYGTSGYQIADIPNGYSMMYYSAIARQSDGSFIVAGSIISEDDGLGDLLARYKNMSSISLENQQKGSAIKLYPNPTDGTFKINSESATVQYVEIFNATAAISVELPSSFSGVYDIPTHISNGLYYISVTTDKGSFVKQIILNR